jgi:hypothetical protein
MYWHIVSTQWSIERGQNISEKITRRQIEKVDLCAEGKSPTLAFLNVVQGKDHTR